MTMLNRCKLWLKPDGSVSVTHFIKEAMKKGDTEEDFIARSVSKLKADQPAFNTYEEIDANRAYVKTFLGDRSVRDKVRHRPDKSIFIDASVKTESESRSELKQSARNKLKLGQPLTDQEIDLLVGLK